MKILLTGCAGFIGSHTLDRLLAEGHTFVGVDILYPPDFRTSQPPNLPTSELLGKTR